MIKKIIVYLALIFLLVVTLGITITHYNRNEQLNTKKHDINTNQFKNLFTSSKTIKLSDFGGKPNDGQDDTKAFNDALAESHKEKITLVLEKGVYETSANVEIFHSKGLKIIGNESVIKPKNPMINPPEFYALKIFGDKNDLVDVEIKDLIIDGSENPQDLFFTMKKASDFYKTPMSKGIYVENAKNIYLHDLKFQHMYGGYTTHLVNYRNVVIDDVDIKDVGGDDITDSFGNAIYLGGHEDNAIVEIHDVNAVGKLSPRSKEYMGWIGVVLENGTIQSDDLDKWLRDKNTTVNITDSKFVNYETTYHVESTYGNVYWNSDNIYTKAKSYLIAAGINGEMKELSNHIKYDMLPYGRNGQVSGTYYSDKMHEYEFNMYNSIINHVDDTDKKAPVSLTYGNNTRANYHNITVYNLPHLIVMNASADIVNSSIQLNDTANKKELTYFSDKSQKLEMKNTTVTFGDIKKAKETEAPQFYKSLNKEPPSMEKPMHQVEIKDK